MSMPKKTALLLAVLAACLTQVSFAGEWHILRQGHNQRNLVFADSALGWSTEWLRDSIDMGGYYWVFWDEGLFQTVDGGKTWACLTGVNHDLITTGFSEAHYKTGSLYLVHYDHDYESYPSSFIEQWRIDSSSSGSGIGFISAGYPMSASILDSVNVWVMTNECYRNIDGSFISLSSLPLGYERRRIEFVDTSNGYVANLDSGTIYRSTDGGLSWDTVAQLGPSYDFHADRGNLWLLNGSKILHSVDSGNTWQSVCPDTAFEKKFISSFDSLDLWVGGGSGTIVHTADGGQSWVSESVGTEGADVVSIFALSNDYVWASTADSTLWGLGATGVAGHDAPQIAVTPAFLKAYPNPSHGRLTVQYSVSRPGQGSVCVYDITGRLVKTLSNGPQIKGGHSINWDWRREGRGISSGVYFIKSIIAGNSAVEKIVLVK